LFLEVSFLALKKYNFEEEKILILVSSLMVWNNTPKKLKELRDGRLVEDVAEILEAEGDAEDEPAAQEEQKSEVSR